MAEQTGDDGDVVGNDNDNADSDNSGDDADNEEPPRKRICRHHSCHVCDHREQAEKAQPGDH